MHIQASPWQSRLALDIQLSGLLAQHVIQPSTLGLKFDATVVHDGEVQPRSGIANSPDLIRDVSSSVLTHRPVKAFVGVEVEEVASDGGVVSGGGEVSGFAVLDLEGDTTSAASDDGFAGVDGFGDLDLETFAGRELEGNTGVCQQCVEHY